MGGTCGVGWVGVLFCAFAASPARASAGDPVPADAPAGCVEPTGADGLPELLARGPKLLGRYTLTEGQPLDTPHLRLQASAQFIPARLGSKEGEWVPSVSAALLPDVDRDGENPDNSVSESGLGPLRIGTYRVSVRALDRQSRRKPTFEVVVEDLGCPYRATHPPLSPGESKTLWISTEGVSSYSFSDREWYEAIGRMYVLVTADLAPASQQTPGEEPRGWIHLQAWENMTALPSSEERYADRLEGTMLALPVHHVEVLRVVLGAETTIDPMLPARVLTEGRPPVASMLLRVTRTSE